MSSPTSASSLPSTYGSIPSRENSDESFPLLSDPSVDLKKEGNGPLMPKHLRRLFFGALVGVAMVWLWEGALFPNDSGYDHSHKHHSDSRTIGNIRIQKDFTTAEAALTHAPENDSFRVSPIEDMGMLSVKREDDALPSTVWGKHLEMEGHPLPTNSWYLNLVSHRAAYQPDDQTRVYTVPYIIDTASPFPGMEGLRVHWPVLQASDNNVQMVDNFKNALCLGAEGFGKDSNHDSPKYRVRDGPLSHLGVGLEWGDDDSNSSIMATHVVRGMPYATMEYTTSSTAENIPTIYSYNGLSSNVQIDRKTPFEPQSTKSKPKLVCGTKSKHGNKVRVESHIHLHMMSSDFTWMVFFSQPVTVHCTNPNGNTDPRLGDFKLSIEPESSESEDPMVIRVALLDQCTTGESTMKQHCLDRNEQNDPEGYEKLLKAHAHVMPNSPTIDFEHISDPENINEDVSVLNIDWDATSTKTSDGSADDDLLMFGLPHHLEALSDSSSSNNVTEYCVHSFHGNTCLVKSSQWALEESLGAPLSFLAPRPPRADMIPDLAEYLTQDSLYELSDNTLRGAADTYFSGKLLARLARVLVIAKELETLAEEERAEDIVENYAYIGDETESAELLERIEESMEAAKEADLPSSEDLQNVLDQLKIAVTVWLKSNAEAPYVYDESWGGLVNCGCRYVGWDDRGYCENSFPDCPALGDVNEDFGNGYYNDHHYHYGYHVYAAAVVAKFDPGWGREHFDEVLLYVRDFANPDANDAFFPQYRSKDWFLGSSWASGIVSAENSPHGRNEESSSEAISAYEGVTLFGAAMVDAFEQDSSSSSSSEDESRLETAKRIRNSGQLLAASEIHATNRYWHVWSSDSHNNTYPALYKQPVVGMLYDTMATFQTWFAPWAVVSYGIQLIPLTPVAETRDAIEWARELYPLYEEACETVGDFCVTNGWSILQAGLLATTGNQTGALAQAKAVPSEVFDTDGGLGNSMTNTIWYIATRREVSEEKDNK